MSWWSEILLTASSLEDLAESGSSPRYYAVDHINGWMRENHHSALFLIAPPTPEVHCPHSCFAGHAKSLDHEAFAQIVREAPWQWKAQVQLFIRQEDDKGFQEVKLWP
jgi:hypothetical protein